MENPHSFDKPGVECKSKCFKYSCWHMPELSPEQCTLYKGGSFRWCVEQCLITTRTKLS
jgi:hypothetical protein